MVFRSATARLNRPPPHWWKKAYASVSSLYRGRSVDSKRRITGGIWRNYTRKVKIRLLKKERRWPPSVHARSIHRKIVRR